MIRTLRKFFGGAGRDALDDGAGRDADSEKRRSGPHTHHDDLTALRVTALQQRVIEIERRLDASDAEREAENAAADQALAEIEEMARRGG